MGSMHRIVPLKVHYYGTPVVLISSSNPDGTTNLAPVSSVWWLNGEAMLGLAAASRTTQNIARTRECVLNLPTPALVDHVDRLALLTAEPELSPQKQNTGYRYEPRKFEVSGLTQMPADLVAPSRVAECPIQMECELVSIREFNTAQAVHVRVLRTHVNSLCRPLVWPKAGLCRGAWTLWTGPGDNAQSRVTAAVPPRIFTSPVLTTFCCLVALGGRLRKRT